MRINFKLFDLEIDKVRDPIAYYIDLLEDRIVYRLEVVVDKAPSVEQEIYDTEEGVYVMEEVIFKRSALIGCSVSYNKNEENDLYFLNVEISGSESITIQFSDRKEVFKVKKQVLDYIFNTEKIKTID